jgi:hypothetical protein
MRRQNSSRINEGLGEKKLFEIFSEIKEPGKPHTGNAGKSYE